ncbi:MAG: hypothetical protein OER88_14255, partial [Planctomycetota bacterium]|nr:hypothetical protein [Planctomycetota bacterium]
MIGLVLCLLAAPDVTIETPLGTVARPGVPALVVSSQRVDATVGGWPYRLDGATMVFVERTPCELRVDGAERVAWSAAPERQRLVGVIGPEPGLGAGVVPVRIRPAALRAEHWRCLDLFDRIVVSAPADVPPGCLAALRTWLRAGGEVVWGGDATALADADAGLGTLHRAGDIGAALRAAGPARGLRIPRPPATAP